MVREIEADECKTFSARLICSERITPAASPDEVKNLVFRVDDPTFDCRAGQTIRVLVPGQSGKKYHARFYSIADFSEARGYGPEFTLCVRRCNGVDTESGAKTKGIASHYLCDLKPGGTIELTGPYGAPFPIPKNRRAGLVMIAAGTGIAPFLFLIKQIYEKFGGWEGKVRLFYGARTGLELLYMNDTNSELAKYYDEETFAAFRAVSPDCPPGAVIDLGQAIERQADELREMLGDPETHVYVAGMEAMRESVEQGLAAVAGSAEAWSATKARLVAGGRWIEELY